MTLSNAQVVERVLARVNAGDVDAALGDVALDATLDWSGSEAPDSGVYSGREAWRAWMSGRAADLVDARFEPTELTDVPPHQVVLVAYLRGRGRASGLEIEALGATIWTLADAQVTGVKLYQTREDARAAAGIGG
jgi:ketosteroid isomerase-like protein